MSRSLPLAHPARTPRALLAFCAAAMLFAGSEAGVAEESTPALMEKVGKLPILYPGGYPGPHFKDETAAASKVTLLLNPARRRAYQIFSLQTPPVRLALRSFDLDTLQPLGPGEAGTPGYGEIPASSLGGTVLDDAGGHLFGTLDGALARIDLEALDQGKEEFVRTLGPGEGGGAPATHYTDPTTGRPKLLTAATNGDITRLDAATLQEEWGLPKHRACTSLVASSIWRSSQGNSLYMVCTATGERVKPRLVRVGLTVVPGVGDVPNPDDFSFTVGPNELLNLAVPDPGADRVTLVTRDLAGTKGKNVWVFDAPGEALAGTAAFLPEHPSLRGFASGADPTTGRLYGFAEDYATGANPSKARRGGLFVFDTRLTPINQAVAFPELAYAFAGKIGVDPSAPDGGRRVFLRRGIPEEGHPCYKYPHTHKRNDATEEGGCPLEHHYTVYADKLPVPRQPVPADLDINTQGVKEVEGRTERTFEASGGAFGTRARLVGGFRGAINGQFGTASTNEFLYTEDFNCDFLLGIIVATIPSVGCGGLLRQPGRSPAPLCWATDREAYAAQVKDAIVSPHEATADASSLALDTSTVEDQRAPGTRCKSMLTPTDIPPPNVAKLAGIEDPPTVDDPPYSRIDERTDSEWTFPKVSCSGDDEHKEGLTTLREIPTTTDPEDPRDPYALALPASHPGYGAQVACRHEEDAAQGRAQATPLTAGAGAEVSVGESSSTVEITRLAKGGVRVVSAAQAKGIRIGDVAIEAVRAKAVSVAKGRQDTATTTFTRTVCGVAIGGAKPSPCYTATQDPACLVAPALPSSRGLREASPNERANPLFQSAAEALGVLGGVCADPLEALVAQVNLHLGNAVEAEMFPGGPSVEGLAGRIELKLRSPEPLLAHGTPGGYIAGVQKREVQVVNDALLYRDFAREIPGLEVSITRNSFKYGVSRQVIQLAGVRATTSYGTLCVSPFVPQGGECKEDPGFEDNGARSGAQGGVLLPDPDPEPLPPVDDAPSDGVPPAPTPPGGSGGPATYQPPPPTTPISKARAFLVRSFSEGILGTGIFFALGLPLYLATRRLTLRRAFPTTP